MKTKILSILLSGMLLPLASCGDDNEPTTPNPDENGGGTVENPSSIHAAYVVCNGASYSGIPGSLTFFNFQTSKATLSAFQKANNRSLGISANQALVAGEYLFVTSTDENTVEIADRNTLVSVKTVKMAEEFGDAGIMPRCLAYADGMVYVSTFKGYVCTINATTLETGKTYKVGSYPEGMTFSNDGKLYVANSDYGMGQNPSISVIDIKSGVVTEIRDSKMKNPTDLFTVEGDIYLLDRGSYDQLNNQTGAALYMLNSNSLEFVEDATMVAVADDAIFICNAPYHTPVLEPSYTYRKGGVCKCLDISVESPAFVGIDPVSGNLFVGSYHVDPATHYADYSGNGYVAVFSEATQLYTFDCGVGPVNIIFGK